MRRIAIFTLVTFGLGIVACTNFDDLDGIQTVGADGAFAIPLINTSASLQSLLETLEDYTFIETTPENLILLRYKGDVLTKTSDEIFASIEAGLSGALPVTDTNWVFPISFQDANEISMDYVELSSGSMSYYYLNPHPEAVEMTITFPEVLKPNGEPLVLTNSCGPSIGGVPGAPFPIPAPVDLTDHILLANENGDLTVIYEAIRQGINVRDTVRTFFLTITDLKFSYAEGYFGNQVHDGQRDTIEIEFFENWTQGNVYFENPKIYINIFNSFGVPTRSIVNIFDVYTVAGETLPLEGEAISNGIDFLYPAIDEVGEEKVTQFVFTKDNSNIDLVLGAGPVAIDYDVDAITNPDNITDIRGFITDESRYVVNVEVELPIYGRASNFLALDTFEVDFANFEGSQEASFKLVSENELPLDIGVQMLFVDEIGNVVDSLFAVETPIIGAAPVDSEGNATDIHVQTEYVTLDAARFANLKQAKFIHLLASFSTYDGGSTSVKVYADQEIRLKMGVILKQAE